MPKEKNGKKYEILFYQVSYYGGKPAPKNEIEKCQLFSEDEIGRMITAGEILSDHAEGLQAYFNKAASSI